VSKPLAIDVSGPSMGPAIPSGARVLVVARGRPRRGEIWAFVLDDGSLVVHRFRRRRAGGLWFQGDENTAVDRPVAPEMLVGRVVATEIEGRRTTVGAGARLRGRLQLDLDSVRRRVRSKQQV
jgi:SOS-response transcriptional repressor LexA